MKKNFTVALAALLAVTLATACALSAPDAAAARPKKTVKKNVQLTETLDPAASHTTEAITITQALKIALQNSPTLQAKRQEIQKANSELLQTRGSYLPKISASAQYYDNRTPTTNDGTNRTDSSTVGLTIVENLYTGGKRPAAMRMAKDTLAKANLTIRVAEEATALQVYKSFYSVILAQEKVAAAQDAVETSQQHLKEVSQKQRLGLANQLEVIRAEQQLSANEASLVSAEGEFEACRIDLLNQMGLLPSAKHFPNGKLVLSEPSGDLQTSLATAKKERPDLAVLEREIAIQKSQIKITRSAMLPTVDIGATVGYSDPYQNKDKGSDHWKAYISLEVPLYDRTQTRAAVMKAEAVQRQNELSLRQKDLDIASELELAWVELGKSEMHVKARLKALTLAKETLRLSKVGYREGVTPQLDLLEAQSSLTSARKDYSEALYTHLICIATLKHYEGVLIPWTFSASSAAASEK